MKPWKVLIGFVLAFSWISLGYSQGSKTTFTIRGDTTCSLGFVDTAFVTGLTNGLLDTMYTNGNDTLFYRYDDGTTGNIWFWGDATLDSITYSGDTAKFWTGSISEPLLLENMANFTSPANLVDSVYAATADTLYVRYGDGTIKKIWMEPAPTVDSLTFAADDTLRLGYGGLVFKAHIDLSTIGSTTIYQADGTLAGNRVITGGGFELTIDNDSNATPDSSFTFEPTGHMGVGTDNPDRAHITGDGPMLEISGADNPALVIDDTDQTNKYSFYGAGSSLGLYYGNTKAYSVIGQGSQIGNFIIGIPSGSNSLFNAIRGNNTPASSVTTSIASMGNSNTGVAADFHFFGGDAASPANVTFEMGHQGNTDMSYLRWVAADSSFHIATNETTRFELDKVGQLKLNTYGTGTYTGTPAYTLQVDASGNIIEGSNAETEVNLYDDDGTLAGTRTITTGGNNLILDQTNTDGDVAFLDNGGLILGDISGSKPIGTTDAFLLVEGDGAPLISIWDTDYASNEWNMFVTSYNFYQHDGTDYFWRYRHSNGALPGNMCFGKGCFYSNANFTITDDTPQANDHLTDTDENMVHIENVVGSTAVTIGAGDNQKASLYMGSATEDGSVLMQFNDSDSTTLFQSNFDTIWTAKADGSLALDNYGLGTYTGTAAYTLQVDASGNVIEGANAETEVNIYDDDGTLGAARTITTGGFNLTLDGTDDIVLKDDNGIDIGSTSVTGTATPVAISLGGDYSTVAGDNLKLKIFESATQDAGIGMSASQLDFKVESGWDFAFWHNTTKTFELQSTALIASNYTFDIDQTVGAGQDNYVLTYDNGDGEISLEPAPETTLGVWNLLVDTVFTGTSANRDVKWSANNWDEIKILINNLYAENDGNDIDYAVFVDDTLRTSAVYHHENFNGSLAVHQFEENVSYCRLIEQGGKASDEAGVIGIMRMIDPQFLQNTTNDDHAITFQGGHRRANSTIVNTSSFCQFDAGGAAEFTGVRFTNPGLADMGTGWIRVLGIKYD